MGVWRVQPQGESLLGGRATRFREQRRGLTTLLNPVPAGGALQTCRGVFESLSLQSPGKDREQGQERQRAESCWEAWSAWQMLLQTEQWAGPHPLPGPSAVWCCLDVALRRKALILPWLVWPSCLEHRPGTKRWWV